MAGRTKLSLTDEQKLEVLRLARKKLGRKGENWVKHNWYALRLGKSFSPHRGETCSPKEANCFCLEGAVEMAAWDLGYRARPTRSAATANACSLVKLAGIRYGMSVNEFNDYASTKWEDVIGLLNDRIKQITKTIKESK